jgi:CheY-specific phosphatase CheX
MKSAVTEESICKAAALFWEQMLAMPLHIEDTRTSSSQGRCIGTQHLLGSCDLSGAWIGRIEVRISQSLAKEATAAMLMQTQDSIQPCDILDATREIANMIAGTLKSALPRPCTMSIPSAGFEAQDFCIPFKTLDSVTVFFRHASGELLIRVFDMTNASEVRSIFISPSHDIPMELISPAF